MSNLKNCSNLCSYKAVKGGEKAECHLCTVTLKYGTKCACGKKKKVMLHIKKFVTTLFFLFSPKRPVGNSVLKELTAATFYTL